jgi:hypothetical protein
MNRLSLFSSTLDRHGGDCRYRKSMFNSFALWSGFPFPAFLQGEKICAWDDCGLPSGDRSDFYRPLPFEFFLNSPFAGELIKKGKIVRA